MVADDMDHCQLNGWIAMGEAEESPDETMDQQQDEDQKWLDQKKSNRKESSLIEIRTESSTRNNDQTRER